MLHVLSQTPPLSRLRSYSLNTSTMHNPILALASRTHRVLSFAYVQALAMSMLVAPLYLSHEHNAIDAVTSWSDPRLVLVLAVWASGAALLHWALVHVSCRDAESDITALYGPASPRAVSEGPSHASQRRGRILAGLAIIILPYVPSSHVRVGGWVGGVWNRDVARVQVTERVSVSER